MEMYHGKGQHPDPSSLTLSNQTCPNQSFATPKCSRNTVKLPSIKKASKHSLKQLGDYMYMRRLFYCTNNKETHSSRITYL